MTPCGTYFVSTDDKLLDLEWIVERLTRHTYWGAWLTGPQLKRAFENSVCFGLYLVTTEGRKQVGFARVVSDLSTFSSVMDVFIEETLRHKGLGTLLMEHVVAHPSVRGTICIMSTKDAAQFYERFGFSPCGGVMKRGAG